ncbi:MAG: hypothetical protein JW819_12470 [Candidatus Krumholzibacteriota bacterium]|nr:hypothetical protein [Candidatus Krumholzibacteriota bacterium]
MRTLTRNQWLLLRVAFYLAVVAGLYGLRGGVDWRRVGDLLHTGEPGRELRLAGRELAPQLVDTLLVLYARDYPAVGITLLPGGADLALEHLLNGRCDLALQTTPPSARTQALASAALGDTLSWHPIALAALELWSAAPAAARVDLVGLRALLAGSDSLGAGLLIAEDPALGVWDAFARALDLDPEAAASPGVLFVADAAAVLASLPARPEALGLLGGFAIPPDAAAGTARPLAVGITATDAAPLPDPAAVAGGDYPLWYFLYICHRENATVEAAKLVTHLTSARGQRRIERIGFLPARRILREVHLRREPPNR